MFTTDCCENKGPYGPVYKPHVIYIVAIIKEFFTSLLHCYEKVLPSNSTEIPCYNFVFDVRVSFCMSSKSS